MLTVREFKILSEILSSGHPLKIRDLAKELKVSMRTIKYDLDNIRFFLASHHFSLCSQTNRGLWFEGTPEETKQLRSILGQIQKDNLYYGREARLARIIFSMAMREREGFATADELSRALDVSRNTILSDMNVLERELPEKGVTLIRRQRQGYRLEGEETCIRVMLEDLMEKSFSTDDVCAQVERLRNAEERQDSALPFHGLLGENRETVEDVVSSIFAAHQEYFRRRNKLFLLFIKLLILAKRLQLGFPVGSLRVPKEENPPDVPWLLLKGLCERLSLPLMEGELRYLRGYIEKDLRDLPAITKRIIRHVSLRNHFPFDDDPVLYANLLMHLSIDLREGDSCMAADPFNRIIRTKYHDLYLSVREACLDAFGTVVPVSKESFVSYITLHFLLACKNLKPRSEKTRALFVCATGRSVARLIEKHLEGRIPELEVTDYCSLMQVDKKTQKLCPDLIISIFPIRSAVPVVVVDPIPTEENVARIRDLVEEQKKRVRKIDDIDAALQLCPEDDAVSFLRTADLQTPEEISQDVIIAGVKLYRDFTTDKSLTLRRGVEFAFMVHMMMLVHRCRFGKQYANEDIVAEDSPRLQKIREIFSAYRMRLSDAEAVSLVQYLNERREGEKCF